jgi:hypothetical protein
MRPTKLLIRGLAVGAIAVIVVASIPADSQAMLRGAFRVGGHAPMIGGRAPMMRPGGFQTLRRPRP